MRASALIALFALFITPPATAALKEGAKAAEFTTQVAKAGKPESFTLSHALKKGPVVLYFFPAAFTPGCTQEAHQFAEATADFARAGATILGVAADDIGKLTKFSVEECRKKFPVGVATPAMIDGYDVRIPLLGRSTRTSYVIAPNGQIIFAHSEMDFSGHMTGTLAAVRAWQAGRKR